MGKGKERWLYRPTLTRGSIDSLRHRALEAVYPHSFFFRKAGKQSPNKAQGADRQGFRLPKTGNRKGWKGRQCSCE